MKKGPCYGCTRRKMNCHGSCKEYEEWLIYYQAIKDDLKDKRSLYVSDFALRAYWDRLKRANRR